MEIIFRVFLQCEPPQDALREASMKARQIVAVILLSFAIALITFVLPNMTRDFHDWRQALRENDRSAADLYQTSVELDGVGAAVALGLAGLGCFLLWKRAPQ